MELVEKQKNVLKTCNDILNYYLAREGMDWEVFWSKTEPYMEKTFGNDPDIADFMRYRFQDVFRQLKVMKGNVLWPIKKS